MKIIYEIYANNCYISTVDNISKMEMLVQRLRNKGYIVKVDELSVTE